MRTGCQGGYHGEEDVGVGEEGVGGRHEAVPDRSAPEVQLQHAPLYRLQEPITNKQQSKQIATKKNQHLRFGIPRKMLQVMLCLTQMPGCENWFSRKK